MTKNKLQGKDLVTVGIYTAIYFVLMMLISFTGFVPIFIPFLTVLCPLLGGIPFMLFLSKVNKFGMVTMMSILIGILMFATGMGIYVIGVATISGLIADLILKSGNYQSVKKSILAHGVFCIWVFGNMLPFYIGRKSYLSGMISGYGQEYVDTLANIMSVQILPVLLIAPFLFGLIGGFIGVKMCKKHFSRAGIM